ncbi:MAG: DUF4124 domain-containing protein [Gammaproteobacteria bacterium]|nr:DUF4124 domain-containing protein [Gammaproteobacteria bacterium]
MKIRSTTALILTLTLAAASVAAAGEIYMWTDKDGNSHYEDRPTEGAVRLAGIESRSTDNSQVQAMVQARRDTRATAREAAANGPQAPTREERRAEAKERADQCTGFRARLEKLLTSRRLYRQDDKGERVYLGDNEMDVARAEAQSKVEEYCAS